MRAMATAEDERLAALLKAIRRRSGRTQMQLAAAAGVTRRDIIHIEAARVGSGELERVRRSFAGLDARLKSVVLWNGAATDRLLDERHAAIVERVAALLTSRGWRAAVEVTFSEWGERGSIDVLAGHPPARAVVVIEVKASLGSLEEMNRTLDAKVRLAPKLARDRFGWAPSSASRLLVMPRDSSLRQFVEGHGATMASLYPLRGRQVRAWLRQPGSAMGGIWLVPEGRIRHTSRR